MKKISKLLLSLLIMFPSFGFSNAQYQEEQDNGDSQSPENNVEKVDIIEQNNDEPDKLDIEEIPSEYQFNSFTVDLSSCRLIVATENQTIIRDDDLILSEYNGVYLLQFENEGETSDAYEYYSATADFVEPDIEFTIAENFDNETENIPEITEENNPFDELNKEVEDGIEEVSNPQTDENIVIAVLDTGINATDLIGSVSMFGDDTFDYNGHGTRMYKTIREYNSDVDILSIKVLDDNGVGTTSSIYAGIQYAIESKADIINLSLSAYANNDNSIIKQAIQDARETGILVVGAAGNKGINVKYTIPGSIEEAVIIGAADATGKYLESSNFGDTVDYLMLADNTSEATAKYSAIYSYATPRGLNFVTSPEYYGLIFLPEERIEEINNIDFSDTNFYSADEIPTNVIDLSGDKRLLSKSLWMYHKYNASSDMVYGYDGNGTYLGSTTMYNVASDGTVAKSFSSSGTRTLRFWMPRVGYYLDKPVGAEVKYVDEFPCTGEISRYGNHANNEPFCVDLMTNSRGIQGDPDEGMIDGEYGAFNIMTKNSHLIHIYITFYEDVNTSLTDTNGTAVQLDTNAQHLLYGAVGLSNEAEINGTTEWTAPSDDTRGVYAFSADSRDPSTWRKATLTSTGNPARTSPKQVTTYYSSLTETADGIRTKYNADFLFDAKGETTLELYVGITGDGAQCSIYDPGYSYNTTSNTYGDPTMWFRLAFAHSNNQYRMFVLDIDSDGGIYTDNTGEEKAWQREGYTNPTDDWYIEDIVSGVNPVTIDDKVYTGTDGISVPQKEGYAFQGWTVEYGYGTLAGDQNSYSFGNSDGKILAHWRNYLIETEAVNGTITSNNTGDLNVSGQVTEILPTESREINYQKNRYHYLTKVETWDRDTSTMSAEGPNHIAWTNHQVYDDLETFAESFDFSNISNDHKIKVTYDPCYLTVNYLEKETGAVLWQQKNEYTDGIGGSYRVVSPDIQGYTLIEEGESQKIVEGTMPDNIYTVNVYYTKNPMVGSQLTVEETANPFSGNVTASGSTITYTLNAKNTGIEGSGNYTIKTTIPEGTTFVDGSITGDGTLNGNEITWEMESLDRFATASVSYQVTINPDFNSPVYNSSFWKQNSEETWHETNLMVHPTDTNAMGPAALQTMKSSSSYNKIVTPRAVSSSGSGGNYGHSSNIGYDFGSDSTASFTAPGPGTYYFEIMGTQAPGYGSMKPAGGAILKANVTLDGGESVVVHCGSSTDGGWYYGVIDGTSYTGDASYVNINGTRLLTANGSYTYEPSNYTTPGTASVNTSHPYASRVTVTQNTTGGWSSSAPGHVNPNNGRVGWEPWARGGAYYYSYNATVYDTTYSDSDDGGAVDFDPLKESTITYNVTFRNNGATTAQNAVMRDTIPQGTDFVADSLTITNRDGTVSRENVYYDTETNQIVADLGDMEHHASRTIQFQAKVNSKFPLIQNQAVFGRDVTEDIKTASLKHASNIVEYFIPGAITVNKEWIGDEGETDVRPSSITVHLINMTTKELIDSATLNDSNEWSYTWKDASLTPETVSYGVYEDTPDLYSCANYSVDTAAPVTSVNGAGFVTISNEFLPNFDVSKQVLNSTNADINQKIVLHQNRLYYVINVTNPMASAKSFDIEDSIPANSTYVSNSADHNGVYDQTTNKITWSNVLIQPGATEQIKFQVTAEALSGQWTEVQNTAGIWMLRTNGQRNTRTYAETNEVINYLAPQEYVSPGNIPFDCFKTVTDSAGVDIDTKYVEKDKQLYYHITVTNATPLSKEFTIQDQVPENTTFVSADNSGTNTNGLITWILSLDARETKVVTFVVKVTNDNCDISNTAQVSADLVSWNTNTVTNQAAKVVINKQISNFYNPFGKPSFLFKITGTDGSEHYRMIEISNQSNGTAEFTVPMYTQSNVQYTISEVRNARYNYENLEILSGAATKSSATALTNFTLNNRIANIKYTNNIQDYTKMNHADSIKNSIK